MKNTKEIEEDFNIELKINICILKIYKEAVNCLILLMIEDLLLIYGIIKL